MDSERITSLIGIPPRRLSELEAAERKLQAVRDVVKKYTNVCSVRRKENLGVFQNGATDAWIIITDRLTRALETP